MGRHRTAILENSSANTRALAALGMAIYSLGIVFDWSYWVSIALRAATRPPIGPYDQGGDYGYTMVALFTGWLPAIFWPIHLLGIAWNSGYCALVFGILCRNLFNMG